MAIQAVQQTLSGITFAKASAANLAIANSATGVGTLTEVILPVSLETGKISVVSGDTNVTGVGTEFTTDFVRGEFLYYYTETTLSPVLVGRIASIVNDTQITLEDEATFSVSGKFCGGNSSLIPTTENILMRVPVNRPNGGTNFFIPNWNQWRSPANINGNNNQANNKLERVSAVGNPNSTVSPVSISYTITALGGWQPTVETIGGSGAGGGEVAGTTVTTYFSTTSSIPVFVFALLNPFGNSSDILAPNTLFKLFANPSFPQNCIAARPNYPKEDLIAAGYNNINPLI